jgi:hypothetical protein
MSFAYQQQASLELTSPSHVLRLQFATQHEQNLEPMGTWTRASQDFAQVHVVQNAEW